MINTKREKLIEAISDPEKIWDVIVIGGGATGLGTALDAASRGYQALLLEQADFAKGTSSRSTKLIHGGVRYLAQGNIALVREALFERGLLLKNAAHLVKNESFIIPNYKWWEGPFYTIGLKLYDLLAGKLSFGRSKHISRKEIIARLPAIERKNLYGGVVYHDGQFDDSRLAINLAQTCLEQGATVLNYFKITDLLKNGKTIAGVITRNMESGEEYSLKSKVVINATGVFVDDLLQKDEPDKKPLVRPSQGIHIVADTSFMPGGDALMIPETDDGRVLFVLPWHGKLLIGTTDTPINRSSIEPVALEEEIDFIMHTLSRYITKPLLRKDVLSIFAGLRPLAAPHGHSAQTKEISRSHKLIVSPSGLITITGGKWTTYRKMAQDTIDKAIKVAQLKPVICTTKQLPVHSNQQTIDFSDHLYVYGSDRNALLGLIKENPQWGNKLHPDLDYLQAEVVWAVRNEMARTVEDILSRRVRVLFVDAGIAIEIAPQIAGLMAREMKKDKNWERNQVSDFNSVAQGYLIKDNN